MRARATSRARSPVRLAASSSPLCALALWAADSASGPRRPAPGDVRSTAACSTRLMRGRNARRVRGGRRPVRAPVRRRSTASGRCSTTSRAPSCHSGDGARSDRERADAVQPRTGLALDVDARRAAAPGPGDPRRPSRSACPAASTSRSGFRPPCSAPGPIEAIPCSEILAREVIRARRRRRPASPAGRTSSFLLVLPCPRGAHGGGAVRAWALRTQGHETTSILQHVVDAYHQDIGIIDRVPRRRERGTR